MKTAKKKATTREERTARNKEKEVLGVYLNLHKGDLRSGLEAFAEKNALTLSAAAKMLIWRQLKAENSSIN